MDLSKAIEDAERIEEEDRKAAFIARYQKRTRDLVVTLLKFERSDEEEVFITVLPGDTIEWRQGEDFEQIVIDAFDRFDTSDGLFPVLRRSNCNPNAWIVTKSLNAAVLDL